MKNYYFFIVLLLSGCLVSIKAQELKTGQLKIMLVGAYEFAENSPFAFLPGVQSEIDSIAELFPSESVLKIDGKNAKLSNLKASKDFKPSILHIAGHGFPLPRTDGNFSNKTNFVVPLFHEDTDSVYKASIPFDKNTDLYISNFLDFFPEDIDLVVLSVSDTYYPVVIDFLISAGVKSAILTNGAISDDATQLLMTEFYKNYLNRMSKHEALTEAQKVVRNFKGKINGKFLDFTDTGYWAAFILLDGLN